MRALVGTHCVSAIALLLTSFQTPAQLLADSTDRVRAVQVSLQVVGGLSGQGKRLAVVSGGKELGSIVLPLRVSAASLSEGLKAKLVHPNGHDVAVGFIGENRSFVRGEYSSFVVIFLRQASGAYLAVDVSQVELVNIGAIGSARAYSDLETVPIEWLPRPAGDDAVQIRLQTRARDQSGQRYHPTEPLIITRDGRPLWR